MPNPIGHRRLIVVLLVLGAVSIHRIAIADTRSGPIDFRIVRPQHLATARVDHVINVPRTGCVDDAIHNERSRLKTAARDHVDFNDLPVYDRQPECSIQPASRCERDADGTVHTRGLSESHRTREGERAVRLSRFAER